MSKLIPLGDKIVIQQLEAETEITHGTLKLVTADTHRERPCQGKVIAVGEKNVLLKPKDIVLYSKYAGAAYTVDQQEYLVLDECDVLAKVVK